MSYFLPLQMNDWESWLIPGICIQIRTTKESIYQEGCIKISRTSKAGEYFISASSFGDVNPQYTDKRCSAKPHSLWFGLVNISAAFVEAPSLVCSVRKSRFHASRQTGKTNAHGDVNRKGHRLETELRHNDGRCPTHFCLFSSPSCDLMTMRGSW